MAESIKFVYLMILFICFFLVVIDVNGKRLFPNHYAYPISVTAPNGKNYQLFGISKDRKHNSSQLANIRGEVIAKNLRGRFLSFGNGLIRYKEQSSGKEGMLNCYGQFLPHTPAFLSAFTSL